MMKVTFLSLFFCQPVIAALFVLLTTGKTHMHIKDYHLSLERFEAYRLLRFCRPKTLSPSDHAGLGIGGSLPKETE